VDHVAVAPFSSLSVRDTIQSSARFAADVDQVRTAIRALPQPSANTGLFTAVDAALDVLARARHEFVRDDDEETPLGLLVVMTDGKNDARPRPGDDKDLMKDLGDLPQKIATLNLPIVTIGFGSMDETDPLSLTKLAWPNGGNYKLANDAAGLRSAFRAARALMVDRFSIRFKARETTRATLRADRFMLSIAGEHGHIFHAEFAWSPPYLGEAPFESCIQATGGPRPSVDALASNVNWWFEYLQTLGTGSFVLLVLWLVLPRLNVTPFSNWHKQALRERLEHQMRLVRTSGGST